MMRSKRVPDHDVGVLNRTIRRGPSWQSVSARMLVRVVAGGMHLALLVRRNPKMLGHECRTLPDTRRGWCERSDVAMRHQTVAGRLADGIGGVRVDHFPGPSSQRIDELLRFELGPQIRFDCVERGADRIARSGFICFRMLFENRVVDAVNIQVEPEVENML